MVSQGDKQRRIKERYFPNWVPKTHFRTEEQHEPLELLCRSNVGRHPDMLFRSTRDWSKVTCLRCHWLASSAWMKVICFVAAITLYIKSEVKGND